MGRPFVCPQVGVCLGPRPSDLGLQHLQEEFVHGHFALQFDAVEVLYGLGGRLPQQGQRQQQLARPPRLCVALAQLVVLQCLVQQVLQLLDRLQVFDVHGICGHKGENQGLWAEIAAMGLGAAKGPWAPLWSCPSPHFREGNQGSEGLGRQSEVAEANDKARGWTQGVRDLCLWRTVLEKPPKTEVETGGLEYAQACKCPAGTGWTGAGGILHPSLAIRQVI